jgi:hypothetical protein
MSLSTTVSLYCTKKIIDPDSLSDYLLTPNNEFTVTFIPNMAIGV